MSNEKGIEGNSKGLKRINLEAGKRILSQVIKVFELGELIGIEAILGELSVPANFFIIPVNMESIQAS